MIEYGLYIMSALYTLAGILHFVMPKMYLKIMPRWVPQPEVVNYIVGLIELLLGIGLLIEALQVYAAWGIIFLLIAVFPANIRHYKIARRKGKGVTLTLLRLPIQLLLIFWAYLYT